MHLQPGQPADAYIVQLDDEPTLRASYINEQRSTAEMLQRELASYGYKTTLRRVRITVDVIAAS